MTSRALLHQPCSGSPASQFPQPDSSSLVPAAVLLLALAGWRYWGHLGKAPEAVVVKSGTTALYGPVEGSTAHFDVPLAALVRQRGFDPKGWIEIEYAGKTGWVKKSNILLLSP